MHSFADPNAQLHASSAFGYVVAIDGPYTLVGAPSTSLRGLSAIGCAYVFDTSSGALVAMLNNPTPAADDHFGGTVAISGNLIVVGAAQDDTGASNAGAAYVFDAATGNLLRTLNNPTPAADDHFGCSVAISGSTVVVGAPFDSGSAYVFDAVTGNLLQTLVNPNPADYDYFGTSVAI